MLVVVLVHAGLIAALLIAVPRSSHETMIPSARLLLVQVPSKAVWTDSVKVTVRLDEGESHLSPNADRPTPFPITSNAITLPSIQPDPQPDWNRELALTVQSSIAEESNEKSYRDLSKLTPEQLAWIKNNHMEPVPQFHWDRNTRGEMLRHGIVKLNERCVLVVVIPFCRFGGTIQYNGDLFKNMRDPTSPEQ